MIIINVINNLNNKHFLNFYTFRYHDVWLIQTSLNIKLLDPTDSIHIYNPDIHRLKKNKIVFMVNDTKYPDYTNVFKIQFENIRVVNYNVTHCCYRVKKYSNVNSTDEIINITQPKHRGK